MPYRYLDDIATADVAFAASGATLDELFTAAADALTTVMVSPLDTIRPDVAIHIELEEHEPDLLLFAFLQELVFYKDARQLLLRPSTITITSDPCLRLTTVLSGERIDPSRHELGVDVKAVTFHRFRVERTVAGWEAEVVLDI